MLLSLLLIAEVKQFNIQLNISLSMRITFLFLIAVRLSSGKEKKYTGDDKQEETHTTLTISDLTGELQRRKIQIQNLKSKTIGCCLNFLNAWLGSTTVQPGHSNSQANI